MDEPGSGTVTQILEAVGRGDETARSRLWTILNDELHRLARRKVAAEPAACEIGTTSLVHEAFIRLTAGQVVEFANRRHFFNAAAETMRRILVDAARARLRVKRGGGQKPAALEEDPPVLARDPAEILAVHEAVDRLALLEPRQAEVVKQRYFSGLNVEETAHVLGVSPRTVEIDWKLAKAWMHRELSKGPNRQLPSTRDGSRDDA
ncbi:MAG: ECF-type sigma factor [Phycisphaerae bacterium]|nr:ECF-type sigma factor [Phycisphaerae bacterium]